VANEIVKYRCPKCLESVSVTTMLKWRQHGPKDDRCSNSGERVPVAMIMEGPDSKSDEPVKGRDYDECPLCERLPRLDENRAFKEHLSEKGGTEICAFSGRTKNGKPPEAPVLAGSTEYIKELAKATEPVTAPCPQEGCGRSPQVMNGMFGPHMGEKWGDKVCPMSGKPVNAPTELPLFPSEVLSGEEATASPLPPPPPKRVETLSLPAESPQESTAQPATGVANSVEIARQASEVMAARLEFEALAKAFPGIAPTRDSMPTEAAPPPVADAPDTPATAPTGSGTTPQGASQDARSAAPTRTAPRTEFESCTCGKGKGEYHNPLTCVLTLREKNVPSVFTDVRGDNASGVDCQYCGVELRGTHTCYPRFVNADPHPDDAPVESPPVAAFVKADEQPAALKTIGMDQKSLEIAAMMKEIFRSYSTRMARNVQNTLGPSEIGTPCDRRLAMSAMHVPPVNPGMDGWASFVGTCIHTGLAEMFQWADSNTGRFAVEVPLKFPSEVVPHGTSDLLDRVLCMVDDHKAMGRFSLDKLRTQGISPLYRTQLNVYGYGQRLKGEKITHIALIAWPREQNSLADLYVVVEPYDPDIAHTAIRRAEQIAQQTGIVASDMEHRTGVQASRLEVAKTFEVADDCTFCPFFAKHDPNMERGCNGRK
jgi:uncharacterized Zn-finger protein